MESAFARRFRWAMLGWLLLLLSSLMNAQTQFGTIYGRVTGQKRRGGRRCDSKTNQC